MNPVYKKLYDTYGLSCEDITCDYREREISTQLEELPLDADTRRKLEALFFQYHYHWAGEAFCLGLQLGMALLYDDVCRTRTQKR